MTEDKSAVVYESSKIGWITVATDGDAVSHILFGDCRGRFARQERNSLHEKTIRQLEEYFAGNRREFDLPLRPQGTEFQRKIWEALRQIPNGETRSYGQIAAMAGKPGACRAVGRANHCNPISIVIPCHRVIGADGSLTGYGGGLAIKETLLRLEGAFLIQ